MPVLQYYILYRASQVEDLNFVEISTILTTSILRYSLLSITKLNHTKPNLQLDLNYIGESL